MEKNNIELGPGQERITLRVREWEPPDDPRLYQRQSGQEHREMHR